MEHLDKPQMEFIAFGDGDIMTASGGCHCDNIIGYGDLCKNGNVECPEFVPACPSDDLP